MESRIRSRNLLLAMVGCKTTTDRNGARCDHRVAIGLLLIAIVAGVWVSGMWGAARQSAPGVEPSDRPVIGSGANRNPAESIAPGNRPTANSSSTPRPEVSGNGPAIPADNAGAPDPDDAPPPVDPLPGIPEPEPEPGIGEVEVVRGRFVDHLGNPVVGRYRVFVTSYDVHKVDHDRLAEFTTRLSDLHVPGVDQLVEGWVERLPVSAGWADVLASGRFSLRAPPWLRQTRPWLVAVADTGGQIAVRSQGQVTGTILDLGDIRLTDEHESLVPITIDLPSDLSSLRVFREAGNGYGPVTAVNLAPPPSSVSVGLSAGVWSVVTRVDEREDRWTFRVDHNTRRLRLDPPPLVTATLLRDVGSIGPNARTGICVAETAGGVFWLRYFWLPATSISVDVDVPRGSIDIYLGGGLHQSAMVTDNCTVPLRPAVGALILEIADDPYEAGITLESITQPTDPAWLIDCKSPLSMRRLMIADGGGVRGGNRFQYSRTRTTTTIRCDTLAPGEYSVWLSWQVETADGWREIWAPCGRVTIVAGQASLIRPVVAFDFPYWRLARPSPVPANWRLRLGNAWLPGELEPDWLCLPSPPPSAAAVWGEHGHGGQTQELELERER